MGTGRGVKIANTKPERFIYRLLTRLYLHWNQPEKTGKGLGWQICALPKYSESQRYITPKPEHIYGKKLERGADLPRQTEKSDNGESWG